MKTHILIFFLFASSLSKAQSPIVDTIARQRIDNLEKGVVLIQDNLSRHQQEHRTGVMLSLLGLAASSLPLISNEIPNSVGFIGGGVSLVGMIITIDSHKWIGRAGDLVIKQ